MAENIHLQGASPVYAHWPPSRLISSSLGPNRAGPRDTTTDFGSTKQHMAGEPERLDRNRPQMLTLVELCQWLKITERHARKLVERHDIPYRKIGRLLRFCEEDVLQWSIPPPPHNASRVISTKPSPGSARSQRVSPGNQPRLPKSLLD